MKKVLEFYQKVYQFLMFSRSYQKEFILKIRKSQAIGKLSNSKDNKCIYQLFKKAPPDYSIPKFLLRDRENAVLWSVMA